MPSGRSKANERFDFTLATAAEDLKPRLLLAVKFWPDTESHSPEKTGVSNKSKKKPPKQNSAPYSDVLFVSFFPVIISNHPTTTLRKTVVDGSP